MALRLETASHAVLDQILSETYPLWGGGLTFDAYARYQATERRTAWGGAHVERMALFDGPRLLASAKRYDLSARVDGRIRRVLGLGSLFTPRQLRGRGAASAMVAHLVDAANTEGFEFALLFSDIGPVLYERLEFVPIPLDTTTLRVLTKKGAPAMLVRAGDDKDLPHVTELSVTRAARSRFALDRSEDFIRHAISRRRLQAGLGPAGLRQVEFLVAEEGHMAVAYLVCSVHNAAWIIEEAGDRDPSGARLGAMLQVMLAREPSLDPPDISGFWPHGLRPPQLEVAAVKPSEEVMMIRPLRDRSLPMPPLDPSDIAYWHGDLF
ncbi:MAG TPA: GNAT family N-acetyltransferase [Vicinamibacterales bacterium]|nr:GNAT family N-acetyltransferase [Vicinamibacterales bacterium]